MFFSNTYGQAPSTKMKLFGQTTVFDSIIESNDSIIIYSQDSIVKELVFDSDSTHELIDSVTYEYDTLSIFESGESFVKIEIIIGKDNDFEVVETAHGFSVPWWGILPLYYDTVLNRYALAQADTLLTSADLLMVESLTNDKILIQNTGYLEINHGLTVGSWYMLDTAIPGNVMPLIDSCVRVGHVIQRLFFTAAIDKILIQPEQPIECDTNSINPCLSFPGLLWDDDFSAYADGITSAPGPTSWTTNGPGVDGPNNRIEMDGNDDWTTNPIDIECVTNNITITIDLTETGNLEGSDFVRSYYRLNGGVWNNFATNTDDFGTTVHTVTFPPAGSSTLEVEIRTDNGGGEDHYIDRVVIND